MSPAIGDGDGGGGSRRAFLIPPAAEIPMRDYLQAGAAALMGLVLIVGPVFATDYLRVSTDDKTGYQLVQWNYTAASDGTASAQTTAPVYGQPFKIYWQTSTNSNTDTLAASLNIYEKVFGSTIATAAATATSGTSYLPDAYELWQTETPGTLAAPLYLGLTNALMGDSTTPASGSILLVVTPNIGISPEAYTDAQ